MPVAQFLFRTTQHFNRQHCRARAKIINLSHFPSPHSLFAKRLANRNTPKVNCRVNQRIGFITHVTLLQCLFTRRQQTTAARNNRLCRHCVFLCDKTLCHRGIQWVNTVFYAVFS
ncbi:hypothetical protein B194_1779 [Serratia plymuthica A30]|nr:hypothetical protein B194_1779 [Serratia plymuthica A30]